MQSVQKCGCDYFLQSTHLSRFFHLVMPRHVLSPCYACYEHARGIEGYVAYYLACLCEVTSAKHVWMSLEKICMGQMGRLEGKIAAVRFAFISFG